MQGVHFFCFSKFLLESPVNGGFMIENRRAAIRASLNFAHLGYKGKSATFMKTT